ncbi:PREDICTED: ATP-binding cassette sub-family G member 8-like [Priapulus caudatus]|uniref:ATP-binding cassette sub-family G member 8-like n=1 Tax=Priapulus caudatus TaxID=37621 RepID=A0ABM1ENR3_PRICU|nr:PREDICTED: ATP-binding cassette sub-family G member 8-like [Priapulus caudatus]
MDPATVSAVVNHQRAESKLSGGKLAPSAVGNGSNDTNLLINFGLPRPTAARSRHTSAANSIDETLRDTANADGAAALLSNMATGAHMRSADAHSQHSFEPQSGARVAAPTQQRRPNSVAAPPAHYRSEHLPLERHRRHRYDDWELYQSGGGVVGNDVPYTIARMYGDDALRSAAAPPSGKFTGTLSYFEAFDDQGEIQEPMVSKYPHLQIREVTAERHYSDGWLGCGAKRTERILDSVSFELRGGELLAILGTADSGVASLISILTGNPSSKSSNFGEIIVNGNRVRLRELRSMVAYMRSDDALIPYLTVEQFLTMYARLKYASNTSMQERKRTIDYFLENARLHQFRKRLIASLAVDQRKLLQLVCQLMLDTDFIVLEEPTSGLEPSWARFVIEYMQDFVARGRIAIMTINQPTFDMFKFFTKVALISDGQLLYFGSNRNLMPYFSSIRYPCPPLTNPCDYYVDLITIDYDSIQTTEESTERVRKLAELHAQTTLPLADPGPPHVPPAMYKQANVFQQFSVLIRLMSYRVASLDTAWVLLLVAILSLFVGLIFSNIDLQLQNNSSFPNISQLSIDDRFGFIFVMVAIATLPELLRIIASGELTTYVEIGI